MTKNWRTLKPLTLYLLDAREMHQLLRTQGGADHMTHKWATVYTDRDWIVDPDIGARESGDTMELERYVMSKRMASQEILALLSAEAEFYDTEVRKDAWRKQTPKR